MEGSGKSKGGRGRGRGRAGRGRGRGRRHLRPDEEESRDFVLDDPTKEEEEEEEEENNPHHPIPIPTQVEENQQSQRFIPEDINDSNINMLKPGQKFVGVIDKVFSSGYLLISIKIESSDGPTPTLQGVLFKRDSNVNAEEEVSSSSSKPNIKVSVAPSNVVRRPPPPPPVRPYQPTAKMIPVVLKPTSGDSNPTAYETYNPAPFLRLNYPPPSLNKMPPPHLRASTVIPTLRRNTNITSPNSVATAEESVVTTKIPKEEPGVEETSIKK